MSVDLATNGDFPLRSSELAGELTAIQDKEFKSAGPKTKIHKLDLSLNKSYTNYPKAKAPKQKFPNWICRLYSN